MVLGRTQLSENILPTEDKITNAFAEGSGEHGRPQDGKAKILQMLVKMWLEGLFVPCSWEDEFKPL